MGRADVLRVHGMRFWGTHGYFPEENKLGQEFVVDVEAAMDMEDMCLRDELSWEVSYVALFRAARKVVEEEQHRLIQRMGYRIVEEVFAETPALRVDVAIRKPSAPLGGIFEYAGCTISRRREEMPTG